MFSHFKYLYTLSLFSLGLCLAELYIFNSFSLLLLINAISPLIILELFFEPRPAGFHTLRNEKPGPDAVLFHEQSHPIRTTPHVFSECSIPNHKSLIFCPIITGTNVLVFCFYFIFWHDSMCFISPTKHLCFRVLFSRCDINSLLESETQLCHLGYVTLGKSPSAQRHSSSSAK